jgi:hypothetical protein
LKKNLTKLAKIVLEYVLHVATSGRGNELALFLVLNANLKGSFGFCFPILENDLRPHAPQRLAQSEGYLAYPRNVPLRWK